MANRWAVMEDTHLSDNRGARRPAAYFHKKHRRGNTRVSEVTALPRVDECALNRGYLYF